MAFKIPDFTYLLIVWQIDVSREGKCMLGGFQPMGIPIVKKIIYISNNLSYEFLIFALLN